MAEIVIVDYGLGNLQSIVNMLKKAGAPSRVSAEPAVISGARKLILPGVGAFDAGMENLERRGLLEPLSVAVRERRIPILGLCLGLQLMTKDSEEGTRQGLGWLNATTVRLRPEQNLKIPHMGWNVACGVRPHPVLKDLGAEPRFYFVHSYCLVAEDPADVLTYTTYGMRFVSGMSHANVMGVQFHPEKSHRYGLKLLKNFSEV